MLTWLQEAAPPDVRLLLVLDHGYARVLRVFIARLRYDLRCRQAAVRLQSSPPPTFPTTTRPRF